MSGAFDAKVLAVLGVATDLNRPATQNEWPNVDEICEVAVEWYHAHGPDAATAIAAADRKARTYPGGSFGQEFWRAVGDSIQDAVGE